MIRLKSSRSTLSLLAAALLLGSTFAPAQDHGSFYNGVRDGGRGGQYDRNSHQDSRSDNSRQDKRGSNDQRYNDQRYNNQRYDNRQGGIGPGKGALIGGAGGAALGAVFGGGLKGALIGGAAGAGIGAVVGQAHQNSQRRDDNRSYPR
jgi:hypothetical protein